MVDLPICERYSIFHLDKIRATLIVETEPAIAAMKYTIYKFLLLYS